MSRLITRWLAGYAMVGVRHSFATLEQVVLFARKGMLVYLKRAYMFVLFNAFWQSYERDALLSSYR